MMSWLQSTRRLSSVGVGIVAMSGVVVGDSTGIHHLSIRRRGLSLVVVGDRGLSLVVVGDIVVVVDHEVRMLW